jgi:hypothetical protein
MTFRGNREEVAGGKLVYEYMSPFGGAVLAK